MQPSDRRPSLSLRSRALLCLLRLKALSPVGMARYARRHTDHYRRAFAGWDGEDFRKLPLLTKSTARGVSPYDLLAKPLARKVHLYGETTGSLGSPTPAFFTPREFRAATLLAYITPWHDLLAGALRANRTCVNGLTFGFTVAGMSFGDLLVNLGGLVANVGSRSTLATPERVASAIARLRPSVIAATPGDFLAWMRILEEDHPRACDAVRRELKVLLSTAELCAPSRVRRIEERFGIRHIDVYACVEGFFSLPCPCGEKHVLDAYHEEVLDESLRPIGREGTGRFAFTNLVKRSTPMVRYLLDDWVTLSRSDCPFGFRRSVVPHGRYEMTFLVGKERIGTRHVEEEIFRHGLFGDYEVRLRGDRCRLVLEEYGGGDAEQARKSLSALLAADVDLRLVPYGALSSYREVRRTKPILRVLDERATSSQRVPANL